MTRPRHFRIVMEPETDKPWVVQYSTSKPQTWSDVYRFRQPDEAENYVREAAARDRALLEAGR